MMKAVIDADFYRKLTDHEFNANLFLDVMADLKMTPVMHTYVYKQELNGKRFIDDLVKNKKIEIYDYSDYLLNAPDKEEYRKFFLDSYEYLTGFSFPDKEDIYTYHAEKENLGEIRSVFLALKMNIPYFASDDGGARNYIDNYVSNNQHMITTMSIEDAVRICIDNGSKLRWRDFKSCISNAYKKDSKKFQRIYDYFT